MMSGVGRNRRSRTTRRAAGAILIARSDLTLSFSRYWGSHVKFWVTRATVLCVRLYEVRYEDLVNAEAAGLYGILKGTGLFDDLGLRSSAVRRGIAASRAAPLRSMKGAPPEVQGSGRDRQRQAPRRPEE